MLLFALSSMLEQKPINSRLVCVHMYTENEAYGLWQSPDFPSRDINILVKCIQSYNMVHTEDKT